MLVEFSHRLTSGLALVPSSRWPSGSGGPWRPAIPARRAAAASVVFIVVEALLGAGLVLFRLVAQDESLARAMVMPLHLANTLVLLLCLTLTAHFLSGGAPIAISGRDRARSACSWRPAGADGRRGQDRRHRRARRHALSGAVVPGRAEGGPLAGEQPAAAPAHPASRARRGGRGDAGLRHRGHTRGGVGPPRTPRQARGGPYSPRARSCWGS